MTDFVISNDLVVLGMSTFTGGLTFDGAMILDVNSTEALLVREDGDTGDVFIVNTVTASATLPHANSFISLGPNTAASGDIRFGNTRFIAWRNDANNADFQALSVDESDILNIGVSTLTSVRVLNTLTVGPPATAQLILPISNDANTPTLAFGDGDSGFYEQGDDSIQLALAGGSSVRWNTTSMRSLVNGSWNLSHAVASGTVPPYNFQGDTNTGMGKNAADQLSLIAGGVEVLRLSNATEFAQSRWSGAFTSDGSSNLATGALFGADITNASGDTALSQVRMGGTNVGGSLTTSGAGDSLLACTLWLDEPDITLTPSDSMTTAATLYISGAPSEGTSANFALFIDNGAARFDGVLDMKENSTFSNPAKTFTFGSGVAQTYAHVAIIGAFTSSGLSNQAAHLYIAGTLTGANGDTVSLAALKLQNSIITQGTSNTITDVAQIVCHEPVITVGAGDTITNASTLVLFGSPTEGTNNFSIRSTGPAPALFQGQQLTIGDSSVDDFVQVAISGIFSSGGASFLAGKLRISGGLIAASGDTEMATLLLNTNLTTQTAAEVVTDVSQLQVSEPNITLGAGSSVTNAQTLKLTGSPTEATNNFALRSTGAAPSLFTGTQFVVGQSAVDVNWQFLLAGNFTTGAAGEAAKLRIEGGLIGAPGTTTGIFGADFNTTITTQTATESIADIAQVRIDEPSITDNLTGDITHASILLLTSSTVLEEGVNNWGIRALGAAPSVFQSSQFVLGKTTVDDWLGVTIGGAFTSGGGQTFASRFKVEGGITGAAGDTTFLTGAWFDLSVATQTATETIADIAQVTIDEPAIIDNLTGGGVITHASTLFLRASPTEGATNYTLRSAGIAPTQFQGLQFIVGSSSVVDSIQFRIAGTFTSGGSGASAEKLVVDGTMVGASGDTSALSAAFFNANITTQTATEDITNISQVRIDEPNITDNLTGNITNAQSLLIAGAPTEGVTNDALRIVSGSTQFPQGSAAAPSIRFGNVGTGIYQATTNDVLVTIDGVSLIKVTDAGSVNRLSFHSDLALTWTSGAAEGGGPQFALIRETTAESQSSVGDLALSSGADFTVYKERGSSSSYHRTSIRHREETLSNVSGASVTTTITAIPDGALVLGVTTTVEVALGTSNGTTGYQVGDGTDADRWGDITGTSTLTESDDADFTVATVDRFTSSGEVTITAVGGNFDGTGDILVVVHFLEIGANRP